MRKAVISVLILLGCIPLAGCDQVKQVENQAYVIVMGLDRAEDGGMEMTVQLPQIAGSEESEGSPSGGKYFTMSVAADDYESALERLEWAIPRNINLSQLKLLILSESLASEASCRELIESIVQTEGMFDQANVVVCENKAKEFVTAMKPVIGERLSTDLTATFESYVALGFVPKSTLAEFYYLTESVYSDPMAAIGVFTEKQAKEDSAVSAGAFDGTPGEIVSDTESEVQTHYLGAALFSGGRLIGKLDGTQTIFANLLCGNIKSFRHAIGAENIEIIPVGKPKVNINTDTDPTELRIELTLSVNTQDLIPNKEALRDDLKNGLLQVIGLAQEKEVEPFRFAEKAAAKFPTLKEWKDFEWKRRFASAEVEIKLDICKATP